MGLLLTLSPVFAVPDLLLALLTDTEWYREKGISRFSGERNGRRDVGGCYDVMCKLLFSLQWMVSNLSHRDAAEGKSNEQMNNLYYFIYIYLVFWSFTHD